jgi:hypothetical protein
MNEESPAYEWRRRRGGENLDISSRTSAGRRRNFQETSLYFSTLLTHEKLIDIYFFFDCDFNEE